MKIAGIIAEYNPFHRGHAYHIAETRRLLGEDCVILAAMSGNFVQRGSPAIFSKHARAAAAVRCGADLVLELPAVRSVSSAERFADGGVTLLGSLGVCTHLSFGSECGDAEKLGRAADALTCPELDGYIKEELSGGVSYASARQRALERMGEWAPVTPNDILGVEYIKAIRSHGFDMEPVTVKREGGQHDSKEKGASASYVRGLYKAGEEPRELVPAEALEIFRAEISSGRGPVFTEDMEQCMLSRLRSMTEEEYAALPDGGEGLYMRMMRFGKSEADVDTLIELVKTKRYAMSRIRRMVMAAYLGITADAQRERLPYIKVLALNDRGRGVLAMAAERSVLPILTKPASVKDISPAAEAFYRREAVMTDLYTLAYPGVRERRGGSDWTTSPVYIPEK